MKAAVVLLVVFGLFAAICATVLVRMMVRPRVEIAKVVTDPEVTLLTSKRPLAAMTVIDSSVVETKKILKSQLPEGALTNSVQVIGKVITRPMVEGEAFNKSCFASDSMTGVYLASAVPAGKRAITVSLRDSSGMAGILYPGSVVDILVSLEGPGQAAQNAVATTLLQEIQVLAIGSQTITSEQQYEDKAPGALAKSGSINYRNVTLLVTPKQAEVLQLATLYGQVALSMRNPLDTRPVAHQLTRVSEFTDGSKSGFGFQVGRLASALLNNQKNAPTTAPTTAVAQADSKPPTDPFGPPTGPGNASSGTNPLWEMLIVRGSDSEKRTFPMTDVDRTSQEQEAAPAAVPGKG